MDLRLRITDAAVFEEIIVADEYSFVPERASLTIIDAGVNIGMASVYFANAFQDATIVAIEAAASNFAMLRANTAPYPNIVPLHAALWHEEVDLLLEDPGDGEWGYQVRANATGGARVSGITIDRIMIDHGWDTIDVLKVDIEGAEREVFGHAESWIHRVGMIVIELRGPTVQEDMRQTVNAATSAFDIRWSQGEMVFMGRTTGARIGAIKPATKRRRSARIVA
jgi:FkbM family methyltransferase